MPGRPVATTYPETLARLRAWAAGQPDPLVERVLRRLRATRFEEYGAVLSLATGTPEHELAADLEVARSTVRAWREGGLAYCAGALECGEVEGGPLRA